jgi:hypothetical protein
MVSRRIMINASEDGLNTRGSSTGDEENNDRKKGEKEKSEK